MCDACLDAVLSHKVVDVDGLGLADAVDAGDALFQDGEVPGQLQVDAAGRGPLEVEAHAAGVGGEEHRGGRVVVEVHDVTRAPARGLLAGEEGRAAAVLFEDVANGPVGQREHAPPLAENDDLAILL